MQYCVTTIAKSNENNAALVKQVESSLPEGAKTISAQNTGGIGKKELAKLGIIPKEDPTYFIIFYEPQKGGQRKVSAKSYSNPNHITMKNSGAKKVGSEYFDDTLK